MRIAFFEDRQTLEVGPIAELRPVFELICGHFSLRERAIRSLSVSEWGAFIRDHLRQSYQELHSEAHINNLDWLGQGPTLFLNGAWIAPAAALAQIDPSTVGLVDGAIAYVTVDTAEARLFETEPWESAIYQIARTRQRVSAPGKLFSYPWQLVAHNPVQIVNDFASRPSPKGWLINNPQVALIGPADRIAIDRAARIDPFVVFDTTRGPISIDAGAVIQSFTRVEG
ncbi:MAG TPA: putative sugar nucleotidyl transferase, partial [Planctomycetaceae bacterium]